jgi:hypothetical protein
MITFKKTNKLSAKLKNITVQDGQFVNEDGEILDLAALFEEAFGSVPFNLAVDNTIESSEDIGE